MRRRAILQEVLKTMAGLFEFVETKEFHAVYGRMEVDIQADDNTVYAFVPHDDFSDIAFISVKNGTFGCAFCSDDVKTGFRSDNNYVLTDGKIKVSLPGFVNPKSSSYDVSVDIYKYAYK